jgi:3-hydroxybutyryl-CoA dehydratase
LVKSVSWYPAPVPSEINNMKLDFKTLKPGTILPGISKQIIQENINLYAKASRDYNPIHIDEEFARKTPAGGTIAHGMLVLAYVSEMMTVAFGKDWLTGGQLNVRFKAPAHPGDILSIGGNVKRVQDENGQILITCDILCANQKGDTVITGEANVRIKS